MFRGRPTHRVSTKVIFVSPDGDKVLMTRLHDGRYGLPGGHVEHGELPDDTIVREISEELGLKPEHVPSLKRHDFWRDGARGRVLLFYTATLGTEVELTPQPDEVADALWVSRAELERRAVWSERYGEYLLRFLG